MDFSLLIKHFIKVLSCNNVSMKIVLQLGLYYFILCQTSEFILIIWKGCFICEKRKFWSYENKLVTIFFFSIGFVFFDRLAINYLIPFMQEDFAITNTQIGMIGSALAITWAISGPLGGFLSDKVKNKKLVLGSIYFTLFGRITYAWFGSIFWGVAALTLSHGCTRGSNYTDYAIDFGGRII